ncbi:tetratricopeptide repeat protein 39C-like isoform X2 [Malaya genurostris]|nr:tetratricopeptide repeat protein 39C-like isoform X2 [Malaya genurostris]XP_058445775.1 tetratricopeptide repeat protein 39C-like isoform X2 [Malaya genurostris]XP_058445776.1 tetratricopeptide repeat protein 39C-like isoform X2 [Malaya genurostris]XP_058445777.1 tetratricopeptide repeat protein 39C-like isoform X2 [Malaya genurostris]XP_058445778.1 tetratricopeptide repeat protein 39C-like isoform X2 [Malaya genurostris]XP_058445779.1 tetratricopeptide repeat protein 39C-like isoform X2 [M
MATSVDNKDLQDWEYVKRGIALWLNNQPKAAEESFSNRKASIHIVAGHTFIAFMNAVISWETDKMNEAQTMLRELEKKCAVDIGWLRTMRTKLFGSYEPQKSLTETLEEQIILADTQLCLAILVSLSQDISGFVKGGWLLRKAWKVYQHTYSQIYHLYNKTVSNDKILPAPLSHDLHGATSFDLGTPGPVDWTVPNSVLQTPDAIDEKQIHLKVGCSSAENLPHEPDDSSVRFHKQEISRKLQQQVETGSRSINANIEHCGGLKKSNTTQFERITTTNAGSSINSSRSALSVSDNKSIEEPVVVKVDAGRNGLKLNIESMGSRLRARNGLTSQKPRLPPEPANYTISTDVVSDTSDNMQIDAEDIRRLMGAASFGYGVFQLSISLLPPSLLKLISFLGFEGDRTMGIACLMHSRTSVDMRAPLSTLALLWYFTIVTPFFAMDGSNLQHEICSAQELIEEASDQFEKSSLFLFFKGRVARLKSDITEAIQSYEMAYRSSPQREIKLLCLHEIGWCRLIQLEYGSAMNNFKDLRRCSQFSKSFYAYLTTICQGAHGYFDELIKWRTEISGLLSRSSQKESQIEKYIFRRCHKIPTAESETKKYDCQYWKLLVYEMLFMWNALNSCTRVTLTTIIEDCDKPMSELNEPSHGLGRLILGASLVCEKRIDAAIEAYRECIAMREGELEQDIHISAFAHYELAVLLLQKADQELKMEAKQLLLTAQQNYRGYDFDNRINVRIHSLLKKME